MQTLAKLNSNWWFLPKAPWIVAKPESCMTSPRSWWLTSRSSYMHPSEIKRSRKILDHSASLTTLIEMVHQISRLLKSKLSLHQWTHRKQRPTIIARREVARLLAFCTTLKARSMRQSCCTSWRKKAINSFRVVSCRQIACNSLF